MGLSGRTGEDTLEERISADVFNLCDVIGKFDGIELDKPYIMEDIRERIPVGIGVGTLPVRLDSGALEVTAAFEV